MSFKKTPPNSSMWENILENQLSKKFTSWKSQHFVMDTKHESNWFKIWMSCQPFILLNEHLGVGTTFKYQISCNHTEPPSLDYNFECVFVEMFWVANQSNRWTLFRISNLFKYSRTIFFLPNFDENNLLYVYF